MPPRIVNKWNRIWLLTAAVLICGVAGIYDAALSRTLTVHTGPGAWAAEAGYWLGHGTVQASVLVALWLLARMISRPLLGRAAVEGLAAFALSGAATQVIKHLVGRPRPRLWLEGVRHFGPTLADGLESFPSGHTSTTVAIGLVIALRYPRLMPVCLAGAVFVGAARILGGAHFPLDVLGGAIVGVYSGLAVKSWSDRRWPLSAGESGL